MSPIKSIGIIMLSAMVLVWSEIYFPIKESIGLDLLSLTRQLYKTRAGTLMMRLELPKLGPEIEALNGSVKGLADQFATASDGQKSQRFSRSGRDHSREPGLGPAGRRGREARAAARCP